MWAAAVKNGKLVYLMTALMLRNILLGSGVTGDFTGRQLNNAKGLCGVRWFLVAEKLNICHVTIKKPGKPLKTLETSENLWETFGKP